ncbi:MAG TPA: serine/threonine-protein kinase [Minicystis sp.]|nr:serine/threonine-protein kinase [Minicystis sp.]
MAGRSAGSTMSYKPGDRIDDRYSVTGVLGQGGHGTVYAAVDDMLGSKVAIKLLTGDLAKDPAFKVRMLREARAMGALSGTSAAQIFAFNKSDGGELYIVMELLAGRDLEAYLDDRAQYGARPDLKRVVSLLGPIAETLEAAHAIGIIHRDVKPGNIFVLDTMARGGVRLLDFGLAKDLNATALTAEGMIAGSPGYIAPEVWRGKAKEADRGVDVYSFAAVVFRALAGRPPFDPKQPIDRLLLAVTRGARPSLVALRPELPPAIDGWVQQALAADPAQRFPTVMTMWKALRAIAEMPAHATGNVEVAAPWEVEIDVDIDEEVAASLRNPGRG